MSHLAFRICTPKWLPFNLFEHHLVLNWSLQDVEKVSIIHLFKHKTGKKNPICLIKWRDKQRWRWFISSVVCVWCVLLSNLSWFYHASWWVVRVSWCYLFKLPRKQFTGTAERIFGGMIPNMTHCSHSFVTRSQHRLSVVHVKIHFNWMTLSGNWQQ